MIKARNLSKLYGVTPALTDVSFSVKKGELVGLLGLNGAGKSTLMNILSGYLSPSGGSVCIDGYDIVQNPRDARRLIGYLPEMPAFYDEMRVNEYLKFICDLRGIKTNRETRVSEACERAGLAGCARRVIRGLSKGYRQRLGFARAMIGNPKVIILDEPTAGLDPSQITDVRALIKSMSETGTVIVSSHILAEIQEICGRVIVLHYGRILADRELGGEERAAQRSIIIKVKGEREAVGRALNGIGSAVSARCLQQSEPGAWDYEITSSDGYDFREALFFGLSAAGLPLLRAAEADGDDLESFFLGLVRENA